MLLGKQKRDEQVNPEFLRQQKEKKYSEDMYDDDYYGPSLFPGYFYQNAASGTEATGLIQVIPITSSELEAYDSIFSYRLTEPIVRDEDVNIEKPDLQ